MAEEFLAENWTRVFKPRDRRPIYEKARTRVFLPPRLTRSGWFDVSLSRHFIGPFDALENHRVREVNICAPVRDGKTLVGDVWLADLILDAPGPTRWVFADDKQADDQEEERTKPILRAIPELARFIPKGKIENIAGMPLALSGPAMGNLQARGYKNMILDEPWMWVEGRLTEAKERQKDFRKLGSNKLLCISQGGSLHCDDWKNQFESGLVHEWHVQCQGCGKYLQPIWTGFRPDGSRWGMRWDEHREQNGFWNTAKAAATARFECFYCGHTHVDTPLLKQRWNQTGKYIAEEAEKSDKKVSFHWSGVATYLFSELVELFLSASNQRKQGSSKAMVIFFQKQMAEFATEQSINQQARKFTTETIEINSNWKDESGRLMTVDQQKWNVFYVTVRQWSATARKTRRIYRGIVQGEAKLVELQKAHNVGSRFVICDAGFDPRGTLKVTGPGGIYAIAIRNGWLCAKGVGTEQGRARPEIYRTIKTKRGSYKVASTYSDLVWADSDTGIEERAPLQRFDSDEIQNTLEGLIESGFWEEPRDDGSVEEKDYRTQMSSEFKDEKGKWVCPSRNNHYRDCAKMQTLGAILMGWIQDPMDNRTEKERAEEKR
jgi:hypothetical protein